MMRCVHHFVSCVFFIFCTKPPKVPCCPVNPSPFKHQSFQLVVSTRTCISKYCRLVCNRLSFLSLHSAARQLQLYYDVTVLQTERHGRHL